MMTWKKTRGYFMLLLSMLLLCTSCSPFAGGSNTPAAASKSAAVERPANEDDKKIQALIADYFTKLYGAPVESYLSNHISGAIPEGIKGFIAKRTLDEGDKNPEIGLNFPRYVEMNGLNLVSYQLAKSKNKENKELPSIESASVGKSGDTYLYFAKVNLKAKCLNETAFNAAFKENPTTKLYEPAGTVDENFSDYIKVQAKFDVEVTKESGDFKILTAKESNIKQGYKNRLFKLNNEFLAKLPYLCIQETVGKDGNIDPDDIKVYEAEKTLIESYFNRLKSLDHNRMNLLTTRWNAGVADMVDFLKKITIPAEDKLKEKNLVDLMDINSEYKNRFDIASFPLQVNMEQIREYKNFNVIPHPRYSEKQKKYIVTLEAGVRKINGITDENTYYKYDYYVTLAGKGDAIKISSVKMNECYLMQK